MRSPLGFGVILAIWLATPCNAYTYYIDQSCGVKPGFPDYLNEALHMAGRANARLSSNTDTDFAAVFERIFKVDKTDADTVQLARNILGGISTWTQTLNRGLSDLRIHCDNDQRWLYYGVAGYYDPVNVMRVHDGPPFGCAAGWDASTYVTTAPDPPPDQLGNPHPSAGQNPYRAVTTFCNIIWDLPLAQNPRPPMKLSDMHHNADLSLVPSVQYFQTVVSKIIIHEWTHHPYYGRIDSQPNPYGWANMMAKNSLAALWNAESYAWLAFMALLADWSYTLPRLNAPNDPNPQQSQNDAYAGRIRLHHDITRRWLKPVN